MTSSHTIVPTRNGFVINGRPTYLLIGTISYFRLGRGDWEHRLRAMLDCGFNCVDVYVPWNFHEAVEGEFDFKSDNRDLDAYLSLANSLGLYVYFRPGPYICNEWDGGGLPSWLYTKPGLRIRQADPTYLAFVERYLNHVNAIVAKHQFTRGGPIILYQLENELDFYQCDSPHDYIAALRDMVKKDGIDVPLTACIGQQTHVERACGFADGVIPTPNIYANDKIEMKAAAAIAAVRSSRYRNGDSMSELPLFVTEMGRDENNLKRQLAAGMRGLGPFNFAGGSNWGRYEAVNNWGGFKQLTTLIDFGGMVAFDGRLNPNFFSARRFAGFVRVFEPLLLQAESVTNWEAGPQIIGEGVGTIEDDARPGRVYSLKAPGGTFVFLTNNTDTPHEAKVAHAGRTIPTEGGVLVSPTFTHVVPLDVSLKHLGIDLTIAHSTAEIAAIERDGEAFTIILCGDESASGEIEFDGTLDAKASARVLISLEKRRTRFTSHFDGGEAAFSIGGKSIRVVFVSRDAAGRRGLTRKRVRAEAIDLLASTIRLAPPKMPAFGDEQSGPLLAMEELGLDHGAGVYTISFELDQPARQLKLDAAGDLVSVFVDGSFVSTTFHDSSALVIDLPELLWPGEHRIDVRTEIWGHANFHDDRCPALKMGSLKGLRGGVSFDGQTVDIRWRFRVDPIVSHKAGLEPFEGPTRGGERMLFVSRTPKAMPLGAVIAVNGTSATGAISVGGDLFGRFMWGPVPAVSLTGGPHNLFYVPGEFLESGGVEIVIDLHAAAHDANMSKLTIEEIVERDI